MTDYVLGLDIGTTSCSAVAVAVDEGMNPVGILGDRTQIFSPPYTHEKSGFISKTATRRQHGQQRRQIDRRAYRKLSLVKWLEANNITTSTDMAAVCCTPKLRAMAAEEKVSLSELGVVLLRIAKHRGYKGTLSNADGVVSKQNQALQTHLDDLEISNPTIGQLLYHFNKQGCSTLLVKHGLSALREQYEDEVRQIMAVQCRHYPQLNGLTKPLVEHLFFQNPLQPTEQLVGQCGIDARHQRALVASPEYQAYRICKTAIDLRWVDGKNKVKLTAMQRDAIIQLLQTPEALSESGKITYAEIRQHLDQRGLSEAFNGCHFSHERSKTSACIGDTTLKALDKLGLLTQWQHLSQNNMNRVLRLLSDDTFHQLADNATNVRDYLSKTKPYAKLDYKDHLEWQGLLDFVLQLIAVIPNPTLRNCGLESGRGSYCTKMLSSLTNYLLIYPDEPERNAEAYLKYQLFECSEGVEQQEIEEHWQELKAIKQQDHNDLLRYVEELIEQSKTKWSTWKDYPLPVRTGNPVVDRALRQTGYVVRSMLAQFGQPKRIIIETVRELSFSPAQRTEWEQRQQANERLNNAAGLALIERNEQASPRNIKRFKLWQEQRFNCPYCPRPISFEEALNGSQTNFEHIQSKRETGIGLQMHELVLAHRDCNQLKGDRWPMTAFASDAQRMKALQDMVKHFRANTGSWYSKHKAYLLAFEPLGDSVRPEVHDDSVTWAKAQMQATGWIARALNQWLRPSKIQLFFTKGSLTNKLRNAWGLGDVIPKVRISEGRAVWKVITDKSGNNVNALITNDEFEDHLKAKQRLRSSQRFNHDGNESKILRIDKRVDHRHHAIDALVVALSSPSLYQAYRKATLFKKAFKPGLPYSSFLADAEELVIGSNLHHTPDKNPPKEFFKEEPCAVVGDYLARRKPVRFFADAKNIQDLEKKLEIIVSERTRELFYQHIASRCRQLKYPLDAETRLPVGLTKAQISSLFTVEGAAENSQYGVVDTSYENQNLIKHAQCYRMTGAYKAKAASAYIIQTKQNDQWHKHAWQVDKNACLLFDNDDINQSKVLTCIEYHSMKTPPHDRCVFIGDTVTFDGRDMLVHQLSAFDNNMLIVDTVEAACMEELKQCKGTRSAPVKVGKTRFKDLVRK
ncbi:hypothetical protein LRP52_44910 [Photobacterium sp. ZSDE20]|uniref:CRISPR-associated endonuclease Cas9 n=1 Tax=Photobacterium pectinilyticum TaxID=2906793 RepID=A0ABT1N8Q8_9GAMM|nr:type II CRISPR RNA-guided endonuclease Cas9 [Photobacterium sp. ZSDE20]MCQ1061123.1 hypothetical protein [Photobacterium sp. ZSDE20]MDD1829308.1 hypothetical protein [Photobacterium sp. ZSDE20]